MIIFGEQQLGEVQISDGIFGGNGNFVIRQFLIDFKALQRLAPQNPLLLLFLVLKVIH